VVGPHDAVDPQLLIGRKAIKQTRAPIVVPGLLELLRRAKHVSEVHTEELRRAEAPDRCRIVIGHQPEVALTQGDAVRQARDQIDQALEIGHRPHDPTDAQSRRQGPVVGMHGEPRVPPLGRGQQRTQKVPRDGPEFGQIDPKAGSQTRRVIGGGAHVPSSAACCGQ
jgi:hypothetical protein